MRLCFVALKNGPLGIRPSEPLSLIISINRRKLAIQVSRAIGLRHRRSDGAVGGRGGTTAGLTSAGCFATTSWLTTASAIHRSAGGVTAWLAGGANQIIRAMVAGAKYTAVRDFGDTHLGGLFAATTSGSASLDVRAADLLVVFHLRAAL